MTAMERPLAGDVLVFDLEEERKRTADPTLLARSGRNARTLLKNGPLRVTLVVVAGGGEIAEHQAEGPITVQVVQGGIRFLVGDHDYELGPGEVLSVGPGVRHRVVSDGGGTFLLTVVQPPEAEAAEAA